MRHWKVIMHIQKKTRLLFIFCLFITNERRFYYLNNLLILQKGIIIIVVVVIIIMIIIIFSTQACPCSYIFLGVLENWHWLSYQVNSTFQMLLSALKFKIIFQPIKKRIHIIHMHLYMSIGKKKYNEFVKFWRCLI